VDSTGAIVDRDRADTKTPGTIARSTGSTWSPSISSIATHDIGIGNIDQEIREGLGSLVVDFQKVSSDGY
jgi:hypothetical protein